MSRKPPALGAPDKLTFLLSLVPYLMDHDDVTVSDVATHFGISAERVRDAVNLIAMSGVPGDTHQYLHGDLFDIQWDEFENNDRIILTNMVAIDDSPRFSAREAAALIAGLQYLSSLPENSDRDAIVSLMAKLTKGASSTPSQLGVAQPGSADTLALIQSAVRGNRQLEFDYFNARGEQERRRVDPLRVESVDNDWYLRGWCHLREAVRTFRLDRMSHPVVTDEAIAEHAGEVEIPDSLFVGSSEDLTVDLELPASAGALIADYVPEGTTGVVENDRMRVTLRVAHYHGLKRLVAGLAGVVSVVGPPEARALVAEWAAAGAARYENDESDVADGSDEARS